MEWVFPHFRRRTMPDTARMPEIFCFICNQPVNLEIAKVNDQGRVVHEECYAGMITDSASGLTSASSS